MARATEAGSRKSPVTYSRERSAMARLVLDGRSSTRTSSPRDTNWRVTWLPRKPEAPVTSVVMRLPHLLGELPRAPVLALFQRPARKHPVIPCHAFLTEALLQRAQKVDARSCCESERVPR